MEDRIGTRFTLITSQFQDTYVNDSTLTDATLDRAMHSGHNIDLKATKSMRVDTTETAAQ